LRSFDTGLAVAKLAVQAIKIHKANYSQQFTVIPVMTSLSPLTSNSQGQGSNPLKKAGTVKISPTLQNIHGFFCEVFLKVGLIIHTRRMAEQLNKQRVVSGDTGQIAQS